MHGMKNMLQEILFLKPKAEAIVDRRTQHKRTTEQQMLFLDGNSIQKAMFVALFQFISCPDLPILLP